MSDLAITPDEGARRAYEEMVDRIHLDTVDDWLTFGIKRGYCTPPVCVMHDGIPMTDDEEAAVEEGMDPCVHAVRLIADGEQPNVPPWR